MDKFTGEGIDFGKIFSNNGISRYALYEGTQNYGARISYSY